MASANFTCLCKNFVEATSYVFDGDMRIMLVSSVPSEANLDSWAFRSDVTNEVTGTGYTAGGINQPATIETLNTTSNYQEVTYTDIVNGWTGASITALGAIIYVSFGSAAVDRLLHFIDFGGSQSCVLGNFSITHTGTFRINRAA